MWDGLGDDMGKLTATGVKNAKPGRHGDGDGLYLLVRPTGGRSWLLRVQQGGTRRDIGLGSVAKLSLSEAREEAARLRKHALNGRDPIEERDRQDAVPVSFRAAAVAAHSAKKAGWGDKTADAFLSTLEAHAYPALGDMLVEKIDAHDIAASLAKIWTAKPAIAVKVRHRINVVLTYSHAMRWRSAEAPVRSLAVLLSEQPRGGNRPAMPYREVPAYYQRLGTSTETVARLALQFLIATAARSQEVRLATWAEIDIEQKAWTRPAAHMKGRNSRAHVVTLNAAAVDVLARAAKYRTTEKDCVVFANRSGSALSDMTLSKVMRDAECTYVPHGFRSSFRDWAAEAMPEIPDPVAEAALAHAVPDKVVAAYKRTDFLAMRRQLLDGWAQHLSASPASGAAA